MQKRGLGLVISSPSGAGKSSLVRRICDQERGFEVSVSVTTRPKRDGEKEGEDYYFVDRTRYDDMVFSGELLEHALVFDNGYGTPKSEIEKRLEAGTDIIFDIDWQGHRQLRASMGKDLVSIFLLPPSMEELRRRLEGRGSDIKQVIEKRMSMAINEIEHAHEYDWVLENNVMEDVVALTRKIVAVERVRYFRNRHEQGNVEKLLSEGTCD